MIAKIEQLLKEVEALHASNAEELEALRIKYLSKKGAINDLMADFRNVAAEQKKEVGMRLNELKTKAQDKINALKEQFESQDNSCDGLDLTRSAYPIELGTRHFSSRQVYVSHFPCFSVFLPYSTSYSGHF